MNPQNIKNKGKPIKKSAVCDFFFLEMLFLHDYTKEIILVSLFWVALLSFFAYNL